MGLLEQMKRERERRGGGHFFGLYRGVVTNVNDPEKLGRIRAKVHELLGDTDETDWASPCVPFGGEGAGWLMLPKTNNAALPFGSLRMTAFNRRPPTRGGRGVHDI